jgi:hypothetical protein
MKSSKFASAVTVLCLLITMHTHANAEETTTTTTPTKATGTPNQPFTFIVKAPGKTHSQLYSISRDWFLTTFNNVGGEITNDDRKSAFLGQVVTVDMPCSGMLDCFRLKNNSVFYKLRIDAKDGEVKMTYLNPVRTMYSLNGGQPLEFAITDGLDMKSFNTGIENWGKDLQTFANANASAENSLPSVRE